MMAAMRKALAILLFIVTPFAGLNAHAGDGESSTDDWWAPGDERIFPSAIEYENGLGVLRVLKTGEPLEVESHPFFAPLGLNGRGCVTCHQPADSMSLSVKTIRNRWRETDGGDPLFAAYDGSNCPALPQEERDSHSLLLDHGLFRVSIPWPPKDRYGKKVVPDFDIEVVRDPWGCNTGKDYGLEAEQPAISVYRRPRPVANLKYLIAVGFAYDPKQGLPLPVNPETGEMLSGNIMADNRATTLFEQMQDASRTHLEMVDGLTVEQKNKIREFILTVYTAQAEDKVGGPLDEGGARGGPELLRDSPAGRLGSQGIPVWSEFEAWEHMSGEEKAKLTEEEIAYRESVARGARVFKEKMFLISDSAGINSPIGFGNPVLNSCVFCHNMSQMGNDVAPGQVDLGTTTMPFADPAPHLPLFKITCTGEPHPHYGREIFTHDPGFAMISGNCRDVGKITLQSMRGLSARAPYFSNGSANDLRAVVDYYDRRFNIGYTEQEKQDLVHLMGAL